MSLHHFFILNIYEGFIVIDFFIVNFQIILKKIMSPLLQVLLLLLSLVFSNQIYFTFPIILQQSFQIDLCL